VPRALAAAAEGDTVEALTLLGEEDLSGRAVPPSDVGADEDSDGTFFSAECREEAATTEPEDAVRRNRGLPQPLGRILTDEALHAYEICEFWDSGVADPDERAPVESDVPALVLAGEYDPVTPPTWGQRAADHLGASQMIDIPGAGHAAITTGDCVDGIVAAFIDDPGRTADASCVTAFPVPSFTDGEQAAGRR
jgi:pimeloyl-ACP methyl ester carboxylesterase